MQEVTWELVIVRVIKSKETKIITDRKCLNLEGHLQMGYNSKTIKNYGPIDKQLNPPETTTLAVTEPTDQLTETSEN